MVTRIYSIGHSNRSFDQFVTLLKSNDVNLLADVRSSPYSRHVPQYNRETLKIGVEDENIQYLYFGDKLGGRPPEGLENFIRSDRFRDNVKELVSIVEDKNAAIMCSELDQEQCHRRYIAEEITRNGLAVTALGKETIIMPAMGSNSPALADKIGKEKQTTLF